ncbi:hypothetical protein LCGC14_0224910 [marine sediment metagenome]|uniref:Uncharacterized protein n=1 Tax=marine sediment metagenome TaxID=412755 RepID=A0A0F9UTV6_9ZZZZ
MVFVGALGTHEYSLWGFHQKNNKFKSTKNINFIIEFLIKLNNL